ncbi:DsbA family protein [Actinomadura oligospora]|uniref:DsbA family protein n=1 Tax=Actinomadura oligospora TaxID=111804 RepID=UPI0004B050C9|nr:thioredoxin domain-containing protein [Actinomadura oligospora]
MSKAARERSARERLAEERRRQQSRNKQFRLLTAVLGAVVVVAVAVVVTVVAMNSDKSGGDGKNVSANLYKGAVAPIKVEADGTVTMGKPGAKATLDLYEDFQCPICKEFEKTSGDTVKQLAAEGKVTVKYHILSFVNPQGSPRAAVAGWCAADEGKYLQFHDVAYQNQPDERKALTVDVLKKFGTAAGTTGNFAKCVSDQKYASQVKKNNDDGLKVLQAKYGGRAGTPSVLVNGKPIDQNAMFDPNALEKAVTSAA